MNKRRRGSVYVMVMAMTMMVGVISLGAALVVRGQIRNGTAASDFAVARLCARAGLEMAMFRIQTDPTWRTDLGNGSWFANVPLGQGTYSVSAADPITGDITLASNHPVVLTSTGAKGAAVYSLQTQVQVNQAALTCVNVSMCSGDNTSLQKSTLTSNQICSSNGNYNADGSSTVNANAQACNGFGGGGSYQSTQTLSTALTLPDPIHVFDYYNANGTAIPYTALHQSNNTQIITNPSFEANVAGWYIYSPSSANVTLSQDPTHHQDGAFSMLISGRNGAGDLPAQDLSLPSIRNGDVYALSVPTYAKGAGNVQATLIIQSSTGTQSFSTPAVALNSNGGWVQCNGNVTISWTGTLVKATVTLTCTNPTANLNIDKVSLTDTSLPPNAYVMDRVVLSPNSNPYGATNSQGIYILNCQNQNVTIGPCRIVGTLVLLNAGPNTIIQGPITWETAVAGYPALLIASPLTISINSNVGLSETTLGVNFNPPGTPYPYVGGTTNANASDGYPSILNGLIYCGGNLTVATSPAISGCVVATGNIQLSNSTLNLTYGNASYANPSPGFSTNLPAMYAIPGTWQRVTH